MRILMFIFVGIALGDKLDRTYLPPPGSKLAGGSPGALQTPLEYPKETYPSTGSIGPNVDQTFGPNQGIVNGKQTQQGFAPSGLVGSNNGGQFASIIKGQQQQNLQNVSPPGQPDYESNDELRTPNSQVFAVTRPQTPRPTFGSNQGSFNLQPEQTGFDLSSPNQPSAGEMFGLNESHPGSQIFPSSNQQSPSGGQSLLPKQGQSQLDSQVFFPPGQLPNFQQFPFTSSTQSPLSNFLNNVPSTTTSYAFTQTTISPFDDVAGTVPPFGFDGQQPFDISVQVNYPRDGLAPDGALSYQHGQMAAQNTRIFPHQEIAGQNQPTENRQHSSPGQVQLDNNRPFSQLGLIEQTEPSYNQKYLQQQGIYGAPNESRFPSAHSTRNELQKQNSKISHQIPSGLSLMQQAIYPGSESIPQTGSQINKYQPSRVPSFQQSGIQSSEGQFNMIQPSSFPEKQSQDQQPGFNKNVEPNIQTQFSTTASPSQRFPQRLNQYQSQYAPGTSTTVSPFDEDYSTPVNQRIDTVGGVTPSRPGFSTPGFVPQPTTHGTFASSTTSPIFSDTFSPATSSVPGIQNQRVQGESDRNAAILNYEANLSPNGEFNYTFDTSNGIHADENGTAVDGVKAQGSFSYIGDDGKVYSVTYSADENGFVPMGDHLPTPPPIPDAIKRVIAQAMRDKEAGIFDDGSYNEAKYGYNNYKGKMEHYRPLNRYKSKKNRINAMSGQMEQSEDISNNESDDENKDYETLEDEIDDIKIGNRKPENSDISGRLDSTAKDTNKGKKTVNNKTRTSESEESVEVKENGKSGLGNLPQHIQDIKSGSRKPSFIVDNTDDGYEGDDEKNTAVNDSTEYYEDENFSKPTNPIRPSRRRPSVEITENSKEKVSSDEDDNILQTPQSNRRRPNVGDSAVKHQHSKMYNGTKEHPQNSIYNIRQPVLEEEIIDEGIETEYEDDDKGRPNVSDLYENVNVDTMKPLKRPKPFNYKRPVSSLNDNGANDDETYRKLRPNSGSSKFNAIDNNVKDKYGTEVSSKRPPSKMNRKRPNSTIFNKNTKENKENGEYEFKDPSKRPVSSKSNRRRPDSEIPDTDEDADRQLESSRSPQKSQSSRTRPNSKKSEVDDQNEDTDFETKKSLKKPLPPKYDTYGEVVEEGLDTYGEDAEESIDGDYEEKRPSKQPQSSKKRPNVNIFSNENTETDYESNTPRRPESKRVKPNSTVNVKNSSSRRPLNRQPEIKFVEDNAQIDSEIPKYNNFNTDQPIDDIFSDQNNSSSKPDKQMKSKLPSKATKVPYNDFEIPENEDDYDYSLNVEPEEKITTNIPFNKNRGPQRKKSNSSSVKEEAEEEDGGNFPDQNKSMFDNANKNEQERKKIRPTGSKTTTSYEEDNLNDDKLSGFEQSTPMTQLYSTKKAFTEDGEKGYQYLPPQRQFNEKPSRIPFSQNVDVEQDNLHFDKNRSNGFQPSYSTTGAPQFTGQQATSRPGIQNQFDITTPQDLPTNYYVKQSEQNVTPSPFASSKVVPQTVYETDVTRQPYFGQTSQSTPLQNTQKYSVTERNQYQSPEEFSTASTPGFSLTQEPTYSTPENQYGNEYSKTRPTYLPSSKSPIRNTGTGQQIYPSGNIPSTTYRPGYSTTTVASYDPNYEPNEQGFQQNVPAYQRPIYGPGSLVSDRNLYPTNGPNQSGLTPITYPQGYKPTGFSTTEAPGFGGLTGFDGQGNELNKSGFGPQRFGPSGNTQSGFNKIIGEDFSGPRRPQTYDPETGYHYK